MCFRFFLFALFLFAVISGTHAKKINQATAEKVAKNFLTLQSDQFNRQLGLSTMLVKDAVLVDQAYWVVNFADGWVIVSHDDAMVPVIGYNYSGQFPAKNKQGYNLRSWMEYFVDQVRYIETNDIEQSSHVAGEWRSYLSAENINTDRNGDRGSVEPLLPCLWNQDNPYNVLCPEDEDGPGGNVYVGCVATAMAQIMYYWRYPNQGTGSHSYYEYPYGTITANFGNAEYVWDAMQDQIDPGNPWEIAEIGFHAAVSVEMNFGPNGSGSYSWDVPYAMRTYFNYVNSVQYLEKSNYSFSTWESMLQSELDAGHPLYYSGYSNEGGHAFVFDGYEGNNYYHINLGWSGSGNGYYTLQDVAGFSSGQGMVRYIIPDDDDYPYFADGEQVLTAFSGSFTDGSGPVENYPQGTDASWLIDPQTETDSISRIVLEFKEFNTSTSDKVKVYGGDSENDELLGEFSGSDLPGIISFDGNRLLITFSSTGSNKGFRAEYKAYQPDFCDGSTTFTEPYGVLSDGSASFYYGNNTTCIYVIQHPEAVNITLEFTSFDTEQEKDKVQVYNESNQLLGEFSGNNLPPVISEETGTMILVWSTNATVRDQGWEAEYMIDGVGINEAGQSGELSIFPNPTKGLMHIDLTLEYRSDVKLRVMDINGKTVYKRTFTEKRDRFVGDIDLGDLPEGIYFVSVITSRGKYDQKIVLN